MRQVHYDTIDSTNTAAWRLAESQPGERLLVTATSQSAGRGQHERAWQSPPGGVWMSLYWPIARLPSNYAAAPLVAAVAVRRGLIDLIGPAIAEITIKWPNDVLVDGRKVAGILCEQRLVAGEAGGAIVIGIGINADFEVCRLHGGLRHPPTTLLSILRRPVDVANLTLQVVRQVVQAMTEFEIDGLTEEILGELRASLAYVGSVQRWQAHGLARAGRVLGIDDSGRLLLDAHGETHACNVGELMIRSGSEQPELVLGGREVT